MTEVYRSESRGNGGRKLGVLERVDGTVKNDEGAHNLPHATPHNEIKEATKRERRGERTRSRGAESPQEQGADG